MKCWSDEKKRWIVVINDLFKQMFGDGFLPYSFSKDHGTTVSEEVTIVEYNHKQWEAQYSNILVDDQAIIEGLRSKAGLKKCIFTLLIFIE